MGLRVSPDAHCVYCQRSQADCGPLSYRHICRTCARVRMVSTVQQQEAKCGPMWDRTLEGQRRAVERHLAAAARTA